MNCPRCGEEVFREDNYCNNCGAALSFERLAQGYAAVRPWYGEYIVSTEVYPTREEAVKAYNSPATLSLSRPGDVNFLAEVTWYQPGFMRLFGAKPGWKVKRWWKLAWYIQSWVIAEELTKHPKQVHSSALEKS